MPPREQAAAPSSAQAQEKLGKLGRREEGQSLGGFGSLPFHQLLASQKNGRVQSQAVPPREHLAAQGPPEHSDPSPGVSLERFPSGFYPWSPNAHSPETQLLSSPCPHRRRLAQNIPRGSLEHSNTSCRLLRRVTEPLWVLHSKKKSVFLDLVLSGCRRSPPSSSPALQQPIPVPRRRTEGWAQPRRLLVPPPCPGSDASTAPNSQLPGLWLLLTLFFSSSTSGSQPAPRCAPRGAAAALGAAGEAHEGGRNEFGFSLSVEASKKPNPSGVYCR